MKRVTQDANRGSEAPRGKAKRRDSRHYFELHSVDVSNTTSFLLYFLAYSNSAGDLIIVLFEDRYNGDFGMQYEKTDSIVREFYYNDIQHYIFENINTKVVAWVNGHFEYSVSFPLSIADEEILDAIKPIYEW